jgi:quercetin 2,3-dioxygenase
MEKQIRKISQLNFKQNAPGFSSADIFHAEHDTEPFLVFTEFHMSRPIFGPHPHAGVSVMTYMLPDSDGSFINRDSRGDHSIIEPWGIHVTQAGAGVKHDEVPSVTGTDCHGFQIWINHAEEHRLVEPRAFHASSKDVPEYHTELVLLRVIQGSFQNLHSPIELLTKTSLFDVTLQPDAAIEFDAAEMAFVYLISGEIIVAGESIQDKAIVNSDKQGNKVKIQTGGKAANFIYACGKPHNEPIVYGGSFVMTTNEQMSLTKERLQLGEMGVLNPLQ